MSSDPRLKNLLAKIREFERPSDGAAIFQLFNTFVPFVLCWAGAYVALPEHPFIATLFIVLTAGLLLRIFIIQHDCGHGSFHSSKRFMNAIGSFCGVMTGTPYSRWRRSHAIHHATAGNLDHRGFGDVTTYTVEEFKNFSLKDKLMYLIYRNPLGTVFVGPIIMFLFLHRFPWYFGEKDQRRSIHMTSLSMLLLFGTLCYFLDWRLVLLVHIPALWIASAAGGFMFYVQHQFEDAYWERAKQWDYLDACIQGSSQLEVPEIIHWFTGNISYHPVHHLAPKVPNYRLRECHAVLEQHVQVRHLKLREAWSTVWLALWDEAQNRMITFGELRRQMRAARQRPAAVEN